ncbi:hypothetical protein OOP60_001418 [Salmonella enterica]|nr:hypothetical protein [Salmonella enterica]EKB5473500.1 hypothetical protein [Salmonella enterica]EKC2613407.1 hypothetical protein [Salmonella enterica]EKC2691742.1 hypothetical protein [Salmonella enterica]ELL0513218.1 hypothetical protein [Salmonella enterica]
MSKTIIGLASLLAISVTVHAAGTLHAGVPTDLGALLTSTPVTGTVTTLVKNDAMTTVFEPLQLDNIRSEQVAAIVTVHGSTATHTYTVGALSTVGSDEFGYYQTTASLGITTSRDSNTDVTNKAITSDGTDFYIKIVHKALPPRPGTTVLNFPLTEYSK